MGLDRPPPTLFLLTWSFVKVAVEQLNHIRRAGLCQRFFQNDAQAPLERQAGLSLKPDPLHGHSMTSGGAQEHLGLQIQVSVALSASKCLRVCCHCGLAPSFVPRQGSVVPHGSIASLRETEAVQFQHLCQLPRVDWFTFVI